jgi:hypothetical protein
MDKLVANRLLRKRAILAISLVSLFLLWVFWAQAAAHADWAIRTAPATVRRSLGEHALRAACGAGVEAPLNPWAAAYLRFVQREAKLGEVGSFIPGDLARLCYGSQFSGWMRTIVFEKGTQEEIRRTLEEYDYADETCWKLTGDFSERIVERVAPVCESLRLSVWRREAP